MTKKTDIEDIAYQPGNKDLSIRDFHEVDIDPIVECFARHNWQKPRSTFENYFDEQQAGTRQALADPKKSLQDLKNAFKKVRSGESIADETKINPLLMGFKDVEPLDWQYIREHDSYDPVQEIRKVSLPVLILQGKQDPLVEYKQAQILHDSSKDHERTKLIYFNDLQHFFQEQTFTGCRTSEILWCRNVRFKSR